MDFTDGSLNLKKDNPTHKILADMLEAADHSDLFGMQENYTAATHSAIRQFRVRKPHWNVWIPAKAIDNPIAYNSEVWREIPGKRVVRVHPGQAGITPSREITGLPLEHKATGVRVFRINVHAINAFDKTGFKMPALRDRYAERYFRALADLIAEVDGKYDAVLIGGDFNVTFDQHDFGWYPGPLLRPLCVFDAAKGIDHLMQVRGSHVVSVRRWSRAVWSDHNLHLHTYRFTDGGHEMKFVSRAAWGATARGATRATHPIGATKGITAHWEGPGMGGFPHSLCARKVRTIQRFHKVTRGWADIAYNAIVCPHGYVFEGRGPGVKSAANGWEQVNDDWYAVCYLGGVGDDFTEAGRQGFLDAFAWLTKKGAAGPKRNGHRDHKQTACPGDQIYRWVHLLRDGAVAGGLLGGTNEEDDDMAWDHEFPAWGPETNPEGDMAMDQQLQQARGYARDAWAHAKAADARSKRIEAGLKAIASGLEKIVPGVKAAVEDVLTDAVIDVDVDVKVPPKSEG